MSNVQGIFILQKEFMRAQIEAMAEQVKDLGETTTKAMADSMKTPPERGLSS